jgi:monovalent cation:H+ antiporter-2, CPA2 family
MATEELILKDFLVLLLAVLLFVPLFQRIHISTVLAYLVAGVVIGPFGLSLISNVSAAEHLGEFGVVFLLFAVGLELKFERFRLFGARVFALGIAQVVVTTLVLAEIGLLFGLPLIVATLVGAALALSSTAVVLQLLAERAPMSGALGRIVLPILLVQDIVVGPLLVFASVAAKGAGGLGAALGLAALKSLIVIALILAVERTILRPLLRFAASASAPEVFTGVTLLLVIGAGWMTEMAGLSMALGAFLAGLMVADTEYRHQVAADIQPFRGLLLGLFFITVGMSLDLALAWDRAALIALLVAGLMAIKGTVLAGLALLFGIPKERALPLGAILSQGSEFAFVILALAAGLGILEREQAQVLVAAVGASMAVTAAGSTLVNFVQRNRGEASRSVLGKLETEGGELVGHVVVAGFGQVGKAVARHLYAQRVPIIVLDLHPKQVAASRTRRLPVFYGDATRLDILRAARLDRAAALVVALPDLDMVEQVTLAARRSFPHLQIFARVPDRDAVSRLRKAGANAVAIEGLTTALELAERVILVYGPVESSG